VPPERQSLAVAIITAASFVGAVVAFAVTPALIQGLGWPSVFYCFGALPSLWFPLW
jgi:MFS transporter, ACS family, solute carrier family 17 (sodium-dependent inorganic phosphate cotransporter), other